VIVSKPLPGRDNLGEDRAFLFLVAAVDIKDLLSALIRTDEFHKQSQM
jgi:hypothetical protein